ncbi:uncharacterized protein CBL_10327 [Carabus blaptoides fortunei]
MYNVVIMHEDKCSKVLLTTGKVYYKHYISCKYKPINMALVRYGLQFLTRKGLQLSLFSQHFHVASVSCQTERKYEEIKVPVPWGHVEGKWWGPQDKRPILCVHGWQESCGSFDPIMQLLPEDIGFLAIDMPGHGYSSRYPQGIYYHGIDSQILLRRLQKYFGWSKLSFMSHSMGAALSFLSACLYPDDVDLLVQFDILKPFSARPGTTIQSTVKNIERFLQYDKLNEASTHPPTYTYEELVKKMIAGTRNSLTPRNAKYVLNRIVSRSDTDPSKYYFTRDSRLKVGTLVGFQHDDLLEYAKRIKCPMLFIKAADGPYFENKQNYDDVVQVLETHNKCFQHASVPGTHHVHINNPERVAPLVLDFFDKYYASTDRTAPSLNQDIVLRRQ